MARKKKIVEEVKEEVKEEIKEVVKEEKKDLPDYYILHQGETVEDVAEKFGVSVEELIKINNNAEFFGSNQIKIRNN